MNNGSVNNFHLSSFPMKVCVVKKLVKISGLSVKLFPLSANVMSKNLTCLRSSSINPGKLKQTNFEVEVIGEMA